MSSYLDFVLDLDSVELVSIYDELPLWSSYFGAVLLDMIPLRKNIRALDIGCGTGFPLIELAQRLGKGSEVTGIDPWGAAVKRIREKLKYMCVDNADVIEAPAESLPFTDKQFDLIVSNNGINNVKDPSQVMKECYRVLKDNGSFIFTVNLPETMKEFYGIFKENLLIFELKKEADLLENHIRIKRKSLQMNIDMIAAAGFRIENTVTDEFYFRFADGSAMLNHFFIKLAFLGSWKQIVPSSLRKEFFRSMENHLNKLSSSAGELRLSVPLACFCLSKQASKEDSALC